MTLCKKCGFTVDGPLHTEAYCCQDEQQRPVDSKNNAVEMEENAQITKNNV